MIGVQHDHRADMGEPVEAEAGVNDPPVRQMRQAGQRPVGNECCGDRYRRQSENEMAHAVEQHRLDRDGVGNREHDRKTDQEFSQHGLALPRLGAAGQPDSRERYRHNQQHQEELGEG